MLNQLKKYKNKGLRPYQVDNKTKLYDLWGEKQSILLQMPTGTGKTKLFCSIIEDINRYNSKHKKQYKVLVLAHRIELINQISDEIRYNSGVRCGIIHTSEQERHDFNVQVASVPTLVRRTSKWENQTFDFIIIDEAHHTPAKSYITILKLFPKAKILGVTATPYRLNGNGLHNEYDEIIVSPSVKEFQKMGFLSTYKYYSVRPYDRLQMGLADVNTDKFGEYVEKELIDLYDKDFVRAEIVKTYKKYAKGLKGIVYTINKEHNKHVCEEYNKAGIKAVAIDSDTNAEERLSYIEKFRSGKISVICNVNIFSEGFDCPDIEFIQLARPTQSLGLYLQQVGRGLRINKNKKTCIFLDNVGLYNKFGLPNIERDWKYHFIGDKDSKTESSLDINIKPPVFKIPKTIKQGNEQVVLIDNNSDKDFIEDYRRRADKLYKSLRRIILSYSRGEQFNGRSRFAKGFNFIVENIHQKNGKRNKEFDLFLTNCSTIAVFDNEQQNLKKELIHISKKDFMAYLYYIDDMYGECVGSYLMKRKFRQTKDLRKINLYNLFVDTCRREQLYYNCIKGFISIISDNKNKV